MPKKKSPILPPKIPSNQEDAQGDFEPFDEERYENLAISDAVLNGSAAQFVIIEGATFTRVSFHNTNFDGLRLSDVRFQNCDLSNSVWNKCIMNRVEFLSCRLTGFQDPESKWSNVVIRDSKCDLMRISMSHLLSVCFERSTMTNADLRQANLREVSFKACDLSEAEFYEITMKDVDFRSSNIQGMRIHPQNWSGATIDSAQLTVIANELAASWGIHIDDSTQT